jgi:hypothetical protein
MALWITRFATFSLGYRQCQRRRLSHYRPMSKVYARPCSIGEAFM